MTRIGSRRLPEVTRVEATHCRYIAASQSPMPQRQQRRRGKASANATDAPAADKEPVDLEREVSGEWCDIDPINLDPSRYNSQQVARPACVNEMVTDRAGCSYHSVFGGDGRIGSACKQLSFAAHN